MNIKLFNDHFQNYKVYGIPKAQLVIADIPYNIGKNAYASNPSWYKDGDNANGESELAGKEFFDTDKDFRIAEFMHFCNHMLVKEPKQSGKAPCMIVFCAFEQQAMVIEEAKKHGFKGQKKQGGATVLLSLLNDNDELVEKVYCVRYGKGLEQIEEEKNV